MVYDETLADRVRAVLARRRNVTEKKMFGGVGFLLKGNMCVGVWKEFLILRLGLGNDKLALEEPHVREFDITGKSMRGWVMVAPDGMESEDELRNWISQAFVFVSALPPK